MKRFAHEQCEYDEFYCVEKCIRIFAGEIATLESQKKNIAKMSRYTFGPFRKKNVEFCCNASEESQRLGEITSPARK